jgi:3',5'-cyclic AMP phosphodiesterase CpdA
MPHRSTAAPPLCAAALLAACAGAAPGAATSSAARADTLETVLYLIGDAGAPNPGGDAVLRALHDDLIVFLGDNAYPRGLPPAGSPDRAEAERRLLAQVEVGADTSTPTIFIPGNHDWDASGTDGWNAVRRQEEFVERSGVGRVRFDPDGGCPGPVALDVGNSLRLVLIDTEWWLRPTGKPMDPSSACRMDSEAEILEGLGRTIADAGERAVVVTGHHPLATGGAHGGYFRLREHAIGRAGRGFRSR